MAPALTEPLSPDEKVHTSSTLKNHTSTRSSKKVSALSLSSTSSAAGSTATAAQKDRKNQRNSEAATISSSTTRVTRSKDTYQLHHKENQQKSASSKFTTGRKIKDNEQMGLSTALNNNNNDINQNQNSGVTTNCKNKSIEEQQILADLTTFEEAITAEICLRQQLTEVNLVKSGESSPSHASPSTSADESKVNGDSKDISAIKSENSDIKIIEAASAVAQTHMESQKPEITTTTTAAAATSTPTPTSTKEQEKSTSSTTTADLNASTNENISDNKKAREDQDITKEETKEQPAAIEVEEGPEPQQEQQPKDGLTDDEGDKTKKDPDELNSMASTSGENAKITPATDIVTDRMDAPRGRDDAAIDPLPPIGTDSTMTASDIEDNIEERLSQLDGSAISSSTNEEESAITNIVPATPPKTPVQHAAISEAVTSLPQSQPQSQPQPPTPHQQTSPTTPTVAATAPGSGSGGPAVAGGAPGNDLEDQEIEEVLKALKSYDANATYSGSYNLCDLNVLFSEMYTSLNCEGEGAINQGGSGANLPLAPAVGGCQLQSGSPQHPATAPLKEMQMEIERNQQIMQRKIDILIRRFRKLQARYICKHTSEEVAGLIELSARQTSKNARCQATDATEPDDDQPVSAMTILSGRPPPHLWDAEKKTPVPASQISSLLRKIETAANAQQICTAAPSTTASSVLTTSQAAIVPFGKKSKKASADNFSTSTSTSTSTATVTTTYSSHQEVGKNEKKMATVVPTFDQNVVEELTNVAGLLQSELRDVQKALDSDATESSSGGESADEMMVYNNQQQVPLAIGKRAAWRYSKDRAAIASRWSWLLSQIADLEIKIRQHNDLYQEMTRTKGGIVCDYEIDARLPSAATAAAAIAIGSPPLPSSVNGYRGDIYSLATTTVDGKFNAAADETDDGNLPGSCRTRGFAPAMFRKRKLFQTTNIHTISKKAARPSTVKCGCQWPLHPCALCTGRSDPTAPRDLPDTMMMCDRVGLLDDGYHPVLSFPEDVTSSIHFEAIGRVPEWQHRVMRSQAKSIAKSIWRAEREATGGHHVPRKYGDNSLKRRYIKRKERSIEDKLNASTASLGNNNAANDSTATADEDTNAEGLAAAVSTHAIGGTRNLSTHSTPAAPTTPLVANKLGRNQSKLLHCHLVGDGFLLEPTTTSLAMNSSSPSLSTTTINPRPFHPTSDYPQQRYDRFNHSPGHSSSISSSHNHNSSSSKNNSKYRRNAYNNNNHHQLHQQHYNYNNYNSSNSNSHSHSHYQHQHHNNHNHGYSAYYTNGSGGGNNEANYLHINDNWDSFAARSRTSSPTHGGSKFNYHKSEKSFDRRHRSSYDIDNIVIPYSVAAATRVEIIQYKEIPTPKWRVIEDGNESSDNDTAAEEIKDTKTEIAVEGSESAESLPKTVKEEKGVVVADLNMKTIEDCDEDENIDDEKSRKQQQKHQKSIETKEKKEDDGVYIQMNGSSCPEMKKKQADDTKSTVKCEEEEENSLEQPPIKKIKFDDEQLTTEQKADNENPLPPPPPPPLSPAAAPEPGKSPLPEEPMEEEDLTDDAMMMRHERALIEERRKFQTYLKFPWSTRSRANRRIDSRAESSGANTPDPASPAPLTPSVGGGDQESIPSPLAPLPTQNPMDAISETAGEWSPSLAPAHISLTTSIALNNINKRLERRRTTSAKNNRDYERRSLSPDQREFVPPYEPLKFPLPSDVFNTLLESMPPMYHQGLKAPTADEDIPIKFRPKSRNPSKSCSETSHRSAGVTAKSEDNREDYKAILGNDLAAKDRAFTVSDDGENLGDRSDRSYFGKAKNDDDYDDMREYDDEDDVEEDIDDVDSDEDDGADDGDDDDDYPKHHLATGDDDDVAIGPPSYAVNSSSVVGYDPLHHHLHGQHRHPYVGSGPRGGGADSGESSEAEPFQDDDPNDPEWKGESADRAERTRKKL